jgi:hypothetical protein
MVEAAGRGDLDLLYSSAATCCAPCPIPHTSPTPSRSVPMRVHQDIIFTDQM